jgi:hypothetical protein
MVSKRNFQKRRPQETTGRSGKCKGLTVWENRLSELANFVKTHGHCNVPQSDSNTKLAKWVARQG